jgi:hypothetical protein
MKNDGRFKPSHGHRSGGYRSRTYAAWRGMKDRCLNPKDKGFPRYGGRGITVSRAWRDSFTTFLADMGECPDGLSIERIDNDRGYEKGNCKWATPKEQANNRHLPSPGRHPPFRGTYRDRNGRWVAYGPGKAHKYLGYFKTQEDAAAAVRAHLEHSKEQVL